MVREDEPESGAPLAGAEAVGVHCGVSALAERGVGNVTSNDVPGYEGAKPRCSEVRDEVLLTVLGTNPQRATYTLNGQQNDARLAPVALFDMLPASERPDRVVALCTSEAKRESWPLLERALRGKCNVESVDVMAADSHVGVDDYLQQIIAALSGSDAANLSLSVDVTHGFRHWSFLTYVGVLYLAALRGVRLRGAYYALLRRDEPSPFLDLRPLLELPRWTHALEVLRDTGSTLPLADMLSLGPDNKEARDMGRDLSRIAEGYLSGIPIELGRQAGLFREQKRKPFRRRLARDHRLPLADEVAGRLDDLLKPLAMDSPTSGDGWKSQVPLSRSELERQARFIDGLLRHGNTAAALGLMNEWTVSWAVWRLGRHNKWLDRPVRLRAGSLLGTIAEVRDLEDILTGEQRSLGCFWRELSELRNAYHHHGMRRQVVVGDRQLGTKMDGVRAFWEGTLRSCPEISLLLGESRGGAVLVSPIGKGPGVLFSALQICQAHNGGSKPALCLVICSKETEGFIGEVAQRAGYSGDIESLRLSDPYGGLPEIKRLAQASRRHFIGADDVLVNVTGGTTLMGLTAEALANAARKLACSVRRFGLIDRRSPERQRADPYKSGDPFWLDGMEDCDGLGD